MRHLHIATAIPWARDAAIGVCVVWAISRVATAIHEHTERTVQSNGELIEELRNFHSTHRDRLTYLRAKLSAVEQLNGYHDPVNPVC